MTETNYPIAVQHSLWKRTLMMLVLAIAYQLSTWALAVVAIVQLVLAAVAGGSNARLRSFGRSLGRYLAQVTGFLTFATEEAPFPFADWPAGE